MFQLTQKVNDHSHGLNCTDHRCPSFIWYNNIEMILINNSTVFKVHCGVRGQYPHDMNETLSL